MCPHIFYGPSCVHIFFFFFSILAHASFMIMMEKIMLTNIEYLFGGNGKACFCLLPV
jgi:hypothetical protein